MGDMKITGSRFVQKWAEALGVEPNETARIVIDARPGEVLRVYVEKFGTERMLHIDPPDPQSVTVEVL